MKTRRKPATRPALRAVRTVSETDDVRTIEGLGIPFGGPFAGRDSYGTFASPRTNFFWDLFPDVDPSGAARSGIDGPQFIRPMTYNHGFDKDIGLSRVGGWSPVRTDADGVWVQAQIDKRAKWYARIAPLLDANALGLSSGSAEHAVRFDERSGEWLEWPVYELALTPTEANPLAAIAARAAAAGTRLGGERVSRETPALTALRYSPAAWDASAAAWTLSSLIDLLGEEADETEQADHLKAAIAELQAFIGLELAEIGTPEEETEKIEDSTIVEESITVTAWASGVREGRRNSGTDTELLTVAHDNLASVLDLPCAPSIDASDDATARSADAQPVLRIVAAVRSDADVQRELAAMAEKAGRDAAARLTGKPG